MDNFFTSHSDIPTMPQAQLERMSEVALSYRQHAPGNENVKGRWATPWSLKWVSAFSVAACVVLMIGVMSVQTDITPTMSVETAFADDSYADITEIAILATLDGY
jgi:hypothetical protein